MQEKLKSPYPYFGSKSKVADIIWKAFGNIQNYIEPFCGSLSILLSNPKPCKIETVNDIDCQLTNFWRSIKYNLSETIKYAEFPVHEAELHARHLYIIENTTDDFINKMQTDPDFYDSKMAGFWVYGMSASVGNNWLQKKGLHALPILSSAGGGIQGLKYNIQQEFSDLSKRLNRVRVCCGDYQRVLTPSLHYKNVGISDKDITGIILDPPYEQNGRHKVYKNDNNIFNDVRNWAIENGNNPRLRIILCGYVDEIGMPSDWEVYRWNTQGGMANLGDSTGRENAKKEVIYFSPHCEKL